MIYIFKTLFFLFFLSSNSFATDETSCILCNEKKFSIKEFACDEKCDAEADCDCIICQERLDIGYHIYKIEINNPLYFHKKCLNNGNNLCSSCLTKTKNKITWKNRIKKIKNGTFNCFNSSTKCIVWSTVGISSIFIVYYFTMGPGSDHYCPCLFNISFSEESSCDFLKYPGCDKRIQ